MDQRAEVRDFLTSRRARITPAQAGLIGGGRRRVPGLRREEAAMLAGVSVEYYTKMERGDLGGVSTGVLDALARALHLDEAETDHLRDLARTTGPRSSRRTQDEAGVPPSLQRFLDAVTGVPMWVRDRRFDFVAANQLGRALFAPMLDDPASLGNIARFTFLNPAARHYFPNWDSDAGNVVATLRSYAGETPADEKLSALISKLAALSDAFARRWAQHDVRHHRSGTKRIRHPLVGDLELSYDAMSFPAHPDWSMFAFTTEPGSLTEQRLAQLGAHSLAASGE